MPPIDAASEIAQLIDALADEITAMIKAGASAEDVIEFSYAWTVEQAAQRAALANLSTNTVN